MQVCTLERVTDCHARRTGVVLKAGDGRGFRGVGGVRCERSPSVGRTMTKRENPEQR